MVRDTARGHLSAYLSSPREAVMDHTLHLHLHLYAPCAAKHQMPLSLQYWKYLRSLEEDRIG